MTRKSNLLDDKTVEIAKNHLKQLGNHGMIAGKLKAIIAAKEHGISLTAKVFDITRKTLTAWIKEVKANKVDNLEVQPGRGRKCKLEIDHYEKIEKWLQKDSSITSDKLKEMISKKLSIDISRSTAHRIIQKLGFSYITPRPIHYKQDKSKHDEFKKKDSK